LLNTRFSKTIISKAVSLNSAIAFFAVSTKGVSFLLNFVFSKTGILLSV
jgi:hypothetical protein